MKITREFTFYPSWHSRGWSWETTNDRFYILDFNTMAKILNDRGWEIESYEIIKDDAIYNKDSNFNTAKFLCSKRVNNVFKEEKYEYITINDKKEVKLL